MLYSGIQSIIWTCGGSGSLAIGAYSVYCFHNQQPVLYFFYTTYFWLLPSMAGANFLVIYTVAFSKSKHTSSAINSNTDTDHS